MSASTRGQPPGQDPANDPDGPHATRPKVVLLAVIALSVLVVDIITKIIVVATLIPGEPVRVLGGLVYLSLIRNAGAAFNLATGMTWVLALVAVAVVAVIIRMAPRLRSRAWAVCLGLILGGALGNLTDRLFRAPGFLQGHVVDFISVFGPDAQYFPVFNVADSAITVGGVTLVITTLLGIDFDGERAVSRRKAIAPVPADRGDRADSDGVSEGHRDSDRDRGNCDGRDPDGGDPAPRPDGDNPGPAGG